MHTAMMMTSEQVAEYAAVSYAQLFRWVAAGIVPCTDNPGGSGHIRRFSADDAEIAKVVGRFARIGAPRSVLAWVAHSAQTLLDQGVRNVVFVVAPDTALRRVADWESVPAVLALVGGSAWTVAFADEPAAA